MIHGMSGSPVYVGGRLVGAVAHGWVGHKSPLCGIIPIADMLEVLHRDMDRPVDGAAGWSPLESPAPETKAPPTLELGLEDAMAGGITLIEWPDRLGPLLPGLEG